MANIIKAKLILERRQAGDSIQDIADKYHVAKKSIITVCNRVRTRYITFETVKDKTEEDWEALLPWNADISKLNNIRLQRLNAKRDPLRKEPYIAVGAVNFRPLHP